MSDEQDFKDKYLSDWTFASNAVFSREELTALSQVVDDDTLKGLASLEYDSKFENASHKQDFWPIRLTAKEIHGLRERAHKIIASGSVKP